MMNDKVSIAVTRQDRYRFLVDFGPEIEAAVGDEPAPLGEGSGPSPVQLLAASIANCLSSSLIFAFAKFKEDPGKLVTKVTCEIGRNEKNRLRVLGAEVAMTLGVPPDTLPHAERAIAQFEDFCTVSQSVRTGVPYRLTILDPDGRVLKTSDGPASA